MIERGRKRTSETAKRDGEAEPHIQCERHRKRCAHEQNGRYERRLQLGDQQIAAAHRCGDQEIRRLLRRDGEPGERAGKLTCQHHEAEPRVGDRACLPDDEDRRNNQQQLLRDLGHQPGIAADQEPLLAARDRDRPRWLIMMRLQRIRRSFRLPLAATAFAISRWPARGSSRGTGPGRRRHDQKRHWLAEGSPCRPPDPALDRGSAARLVRPLCEPSGRSREDVLGWRDRDGQDHHGPDLRDQACARPAARTGPAQSARQTRWGQRDAAE